MSGASSKSQQKMFADTPSATGFAGGGFWSLALRWAGWPDDRPCWTGSCPCPSFSAAGKGAGFDDPRHLWPDWARLVREHRPPVVFGEQVAAAVGYGWLDLVQADMEAAAYTFGQLDPAYARWLMAVPPAWDGYVCTATASLSRRRRRSSGRTAQPAPVSGGKVRTTPYDQAYQTVANQEEAPRHTSRPSNTRRDCGNPPASIRAQRRSVRTEPCP